MEARSTDGDRSAMVRAAVTRVDRNELKAALDLTAAPGFQAPKAVVNALNALRKHRDPAGVVTRPQYRAALPYVAGAVADACLSRTIEVLGDHSEDPDQGAAARRARPDPWLVSGAHHRGHAGHGGRRRHARLRSLLRDRGR